jgi:hypothetical protein
MLHTHIPDAKTAELAGETFIGPLSQIPRQYTSINDQFNLLKAERESKRCDQF